MRTNAIWAKIQVFEFYFWVFDYLHFSTISEVLGIVFTKGLRGKHIRGWLGEKLHRIGGEKLIFRVDLRLIRLLIILEEIPNVGM